MNAKEIFIKAHEMAKACKLANPSDNYRVNFGAALKALYQEAKETEKTTRYQIKAWFYNKNADKLTTAHCHASPYFGKEDVIKETEKAFQIRLELVTNETGADTAYTKLVWVPKSCVEAYTF